MSEETPVSVTMEKDGDVAVIIVNNPPVNALSWHVRQGLEDHFAAALADDSVKAIVLRCDGATFIAGADISEFGKPPRGPDFNAVLNSIEAASKPVVAAIHGTALGGGLETALVCHYRIAVPSAKLGVPEVKLGLLPGAGGTQRLPRVVGVEAAATMTSTGDPLPAAKAKELGLVDELAGEDSLAADAIAFARAKIADGPRPTRERPVFGDVAVIEAAQDRERQALARVRGALRQPRLRRSRDAPALRRRPRLRARAVHEADVRQPVGRAAPHLLRRASGREDRRPAQGHPAARHQEGRRDRRRHDGRRDLDELPAEGHPGHDRRDAAGGARPRRRRDPQELRSVAPPRAVSSPNRSSR